MLKYWYRTTVIRVLNDCSVYGSKDVLRKPLLQKKRNHIVI